MASLLHSTAARRSLLRVMRFEPAIAACGNTLASSASQPGALLSHNFSSYAIPHLEDLPNEDTKQRVVYRGSAGADVSPWHDVPAFVAGTADIHCVVTAPKGSRAILNPAYHEELNPLKLLNGANGKPEMRGTPPPFHVGFIPQTYVNAAVAAVDASGAPQVVSGAQGKPSYQALQVLDLTQGRVRLGSIQRLHVLGAFGSEEGGVMSWTILGAQVDDNTAEVYRQEIDALGVSPDIHAVVDPVLRHMLSNAAHWLQHDSSASSGAVSMLNQGRLLPPSAAENLISVFHKAWANLVFTPKDERALFGFDVLRKAFPGPWVPAQGWQPPVSEYATAEQAAVYQAAALPAPDAAAYYAQGGSPSGASLSGVTEQPVHETAAGTASIVQRSIAGQEGIEHAGVSSEAAAAGLAAAAAADAQLHSVKLPGYLAGAAVEKDIPAQDSSAKNTLHTFSADESAAGIAYLNGEELQATPEELKAWETFQTLDAATATWEQVVEAFGGDQELASMWRATQQAHMISESGAQEAAASMPSLSAGPGGETRA